MTTTVKKQAEKSTTNGVAHPSGMSIEMRGLDQIRPYEKNPRNNDVAVEAVARSIMEYGFRQPIVVDREGIIVVGHTRWKAAQHLGLEQVPVHVADLTPEQAKAYRLADNRTAMIAEWNDDLLAIELGELKALDIDLAGLGFSDVEISKLLEPGLEVGATDPDDIPAPPDEAITQPGDLWILGNHRLLCGDSGSVADVDRLLDGAVTRCALRRCDRAALGELHREEGSAGSGGRQGVMPCRVSSTSRRSSGCLPGLRVPGR